MEKIGAWLKGHVLVVAAAALGIAFVEVRGTFGAPSRTSGEEGQGAGGTPLGRGAPVCLGLSGG